MNIPYWLDYIEQSTSAHGLRNIFNKTFALVEDPQVHNRFFERIDFLRKRSFFGHEVRALDDLKEEIELELETQSRLQTELKKAALLKAQMKAGKEVQIAEVLVRAEEEMALSPLEESASASTQYLKDFDFLSQKDLYFKVEQELILKTLFKCDYNRTLTANVLGISIRTLRNKLNFYTGNKTVHRYERRLSKVEGLVLH